MAGVEVSKLQCGERHFYSHYSVVPIRYRVIGEDKEGFVLASDEQGNIRTIHPKVAAGLLKGRL
jgi:hypothetical protein